MKFKILILLLIASISVQAQDDQCFVDFETFYENGDFVERKFVGPSYANSIPTEFDHSELTFDEYTVTNNRTEDYYADIKITAGGLSSFTIPENKSASFSAGTEIILKPGFHAIAGSDFKASVNSD